MLTMLLQAILPSGTCYFLLCLQQRLLLLAGILCVSCPFKGALPLPHNSRWLYSSQLNDLAWYTTEKSHLSGAALFSAYLCQLESENFLVFSSTKGVQVLLKSHWLHYQYRGSLFTTDSCRKKRRSPQRNVMSKLTHHRFKISVIVEKITISQNSPQPEV